MTLFSFCFVCLFCFCFSLLMKTKLISGQSDVVRIVESTDMETSIKDVPFLLAFSS